MELKYTKISALALLTCLSQSLLALVNHGQMQARFKANAEAVKKAVPGWAQMENVNAVDAAYKATTQQAAPSTTQQAAPSTTQPAHLPQDENKSLRDKNAELRDENKSLRDENAELRRELQDGQAKATKGCIADKVANMPAQHVANAAVTLIDRAGLKGEINGPGAERVIAAVDGQPSHMLGRLGKPAVKKQKSFKRYAH